MAGGLIEQRAKELTAEQISRLLDSGGSSGMAGAAVNPRNAMQVTTVLACARVIAEGCATPDLRVWREIRKDGKISRERATNIPEARLLEARPNEWQTSYEWRRMMTLHAALAGAGLSVVVRGANNRITELLPIQPGSWTMVHNSRYQYEYHCYDPFGLIGVFPHDQVLVLRNLEWEMQRNLVPVELAASAIDLAMTTDGNMRRQQRNGQQPPGVYSVTSRLNDEQHTRLTNWIRAKTSGENANAPLVLDSGATWTSTGSNNRDAQMRELRDFTVEDICRAWNVFPIMIGHSDKTSTFASAESFFAAHLKHTLLPWQTNWRAILDEFALDGAGPLFTTFDNRYLEKGSMRDQAVWARNMAEAGIWTRNELRDEDGLDPLPGLDEPLTPMNTNTTTGDPKNGTSQNPPAGAA